ncbi:MAG TPA: S-adenosyl-l-methionine hydroxide adenosyltransferase family protein [Anaerolineaceae bacterium]|jgi:S-adenosylmethionine hydrolase|nr:S-adenosyl-l-methionine hydroxide adenosyltransferase family protein [Anaerolineaceae bacterium]
MKPILVFQTDFTYKEGAVCAMYGVVKSVDRELEIIDGTHEIPRYDIWSASYRLYQSMRFWPQGTMFVSVVDPGVGTKRRACVARTTDGYTVVTPDNGTLTHLKQRVGITAVREIDERTNRLKGKGTEQTSVFHGRDLFAYCAARLASGIISYEQVGKEYPVEKIVAQAILEAQVEKGRARGIIEINDPNFGNLWSNIPLELFRQAGFNYGERLQVTIRYSGNVVYMNRVLFERSFGYAKRGEIILYTNELMRIGLAVNQGNFSEHFKISYGAEWEVEITK